MQNFVIVGGGLTAATAAETLREEGFDGTIQLVGSEAHLPYLRPPLSKEYFTGDGSRDEIFVHPADWYEENDIDVESGFAVASIDPEKHTVTLHDERTLPYDKLLLATGAEPRRLEVAGADADGIHYVRTVDQSEALRSALEKGGKRVAVIGTGWIGLELASGAKKYGNEVTVIGRDTIPLQKALGDEMGAVFRQLHEDNGVTMLMSSTVEAIEVSGGAVSGVRLGDQTVAADVVIAGLGAVPYLDLAQRAGLTIDNGVTVDEHLATSAADVYAAGDIANAWHPVIRQRMRNEHWANAIGTGRVAAKSMLGTDADYDEIPYFYTDQFDLGMEYSGYPPLAAGATVVVRGSTEKREFIAFWVADGRVVAGMNVNVWDVNEDVQKIIRGEKQVDAGRLADPEVRLAEFQ